MISVDLFCGCGGSTLGYARAGIKVKYGIDIWNVAVSSYNKNNKGRGICEDLKLYTPEQFAKDKELKNIDILTGSPPCQGFSLAGRRDVKDPRNSLFVNFVAYLNYFSPKAFVIENVVGILSMKTEKKVKVIDIIMKELEKNYNCKIFKLLASDYKIPQNRRRVFIIGYRKDLGIIPTAPKEVSKNNHIPVKSVLEENVDKSYYLSEKAILGIKRRREKMKKRKCGFGAQFLDLEKPSYTISARYWKDGYDALVKEDEEHLRRLTITELKRIQGFPDDYELCGSKREQIIQIGNAVPSNFTYYIGKEIMRKLKTKI